MYCIFLPLNIETDFFPQRLLELVRRGLGINDDEVYHQFINGIIETCNFEVRLTTQRISLKSALKKSHELPSVCYRS